MTPTDKRSLLAVLAVVLIACAGSVWMDAENARQVAAQPTPVHTITPMATATPEPTPETPDYSAIPLDESLTDALVAACVANEVSLPLALAVMEQESGFEVDAVGVDGHDVGLFQIRSTNHAWLTEETGADPLTPEGNIICGVWFLAYLYDYCDQDWSAALTCWRWGPGNGETCKYSEAVLEAAERWATTCQRKP